MSSKRKFTRPRLAGSGALTIKDIGTAAQSLANYCYREGEAADLNVISSQIRLIADRATIVELERTRETVTK